MSPFAFPDRPHFRRHGPRGYARHESYRDWLRDEFAFRCVFCLTREQWVNAKGAFAVDHFVPISIDPSLDNEYDNLLYACVACNLTRGNQLVPNPLEHLLASTVESQSDGRFRPLTSPAHEIVQILCLNDPEYVRRRSQMIALLEELEKSRPDLHSSWLGFPDDLPNLERLRPPGGNSRSGGIEQSHFARRRRGELARSY